MMKKGFSLKFTIISSVILAAALGYIFFPRAAYNASDRVKPYYSGDAVSFNGRILIASTNMKGVEIFEVSDGQISLLNNFSSFDAIYAGSPDFNDAVFKIEDDKLYLYLSDGKYIYKYDLTDARQPLLKYQVMDNSYDWFLGLGRCGDNLTSQGTKGLKIWNKDLQVIFSNNLVNTEPKNVELDKACRLVFNVNGDQIEAMDRFENRNLPVIKINADENHYRKILFDENARSFYLVDDWSVKQFNYEGKVLKNFNHISGLGYDVAASTDPRFIYFSDGIGVVKLLKADLRPVRWSFTTDLGGRNGWAMRIFAVKDGAGEKLIVFNNSNILVFNDNLELVDSHAATQPDNSPRGQAKISSDITIASAGQLATVSGQGFMPHEDIKISLAGKSIYGLADDNGLFRQIIETPPARAGMYDLSAEGLASARTFAITFKIINFN